MKKQQLTNYYCDIIDKAVFNTPVPFLRKYPGIFEHYSEILTHIEKITHVLYNLIKIQFNAPETNFLQSMMNEVLDSGIADEKQAKVLVQVIKWKYSQIRNQLIKKEIASSGSRMIGHDWKLKNILGNSSFTHKNKFILELTVFVVQGSGRCEKQKKISLELSVGEVRQLLTKLKQIKKDLSVNGL